VSSSPAEEVLADSSESSYTNDWVNNLENTLEGVSDMNTDALARSNLKSVEISRPPSKEDFLVPTNAQYTSTW
jgi:hypothetical protein